MKNKINRLLAAVLALVMTVSMLQPMTLSAFAFDAGDLTETVDPETQCVICQHNAMDHTGVHTANDRVEKCKQCAAGQVDCDCAGKTWAECTGNAIAYIMAALEDKTDAEVCARYVNVTLTDKRSGIAKVVDFLKQLQNEEKISERSPGCWQVFNADGTLLGLVYVLDSHSFIEGTCMWCDLVCDHNGEIYGVCEICDKDMGPDPFVDIKAQLAGKTDAEVCAYTSKGQRGADNVLNAIKQLRDVKEVRQFTGGWQIFDSGYGVVDVVYVWNTHFFSDGTCSRCSFVCDHNGAESGTCGICHKYLSSTSEFLANIKAQLAGKTEADVCVKLSDKDFVITKGPANVLAILENYESVTDLLPIGDSVYDFNTFDNKYRLVLSQEHDYMDGFCLACSFKDPEGHTPPRSTPGRCWRQ